MTFNNVGMPVSGMVGHELVNGTTYFPADVTNYSMVPEPVITVSPLPNSGQGNGIGSLTSGEPYIYYPDSAPLVFPATSAPASFMSPFTFPTVIPADGVYDVPGGKAIIKRILISDKHIEDAEIELGYKQSPAELDKIKRELDDFLQFEERDI